MANAENKILGSIYYEGFTFSGQVGFRVVFSMLHLQNYIMLMTNENVILSILATSPKLFSTDQNPCSVVNIEIAVK